MIGAGARALAVAGTLLAIVPAATAFAQATPPRPAARRAGLGLELAAAVTLTTPGSFGTSTASFLAPDGSPLPITRSETRLGAGFGVEAHFGFRRGRPLQIEASGTWVREAYRTEVEFDVENAQLITAEQTVSRFAVEGAALWVFRRRGSSEYFFRGSAGWGINVAYQTGIGDGLTASGGAGVKYWFKPKTASAQPKTGIRVEGRLCLRPLGLPDDARSRLASFVVAGGVMFRF